MTIEKFPPVNVLAVMRGFNQPGIPYPVTPYRFETRDRRRYKISEVRQMYRERVGTSFHYHYVVKTDEQKYFHLVLEAQTYIWRIIQEVENHFFFK